MDKARRTMVLGGLFGAAAVGASKIVGNGAQAADKKTFEVTRSDEEWRRMLTPEQYQVLRKHGTERAGTSPLDKEYRKGTFLCAGCDLAVYPSDTKFDSKTGWPSFWAPITEAAVGTSEDRQFFMTRTEVHCARCGGHLGHIFDDGPKPTGKRHCLNGVALKFTPAEEKVTGTL